MSRIRSQLDTILAGNQAAPAAHAPMPRRAFEPASPQSPAPQSPAAPQPYSTAQPAMPAPPQPQPAPARSQDLAHLQQSLEQLSQRISAIPRQQPAEGMQASQNRIVEEIRNGYQQVSREIASIRQADNHHVEDDLKRIAEGIAMLQNSQSVHPDYMEQMQAELANLNNGVNQIIASPPSQIDLSGVTESIHSGYSDIVNKLDEVLSQRGNELPPFDLPDYSDQFKSIHQRLEEVTRAVISMTVSPNGNADQHSLERIEARLASLAKSVDAIGEDGHAPASAITSGETATIAEQIEKLSEKLDNIGVMGDAGANIFSDVQGIATRLDSLQNEFGILASSLDGAFAGQQPENPGGAHLGELEQRLGELASRLESAAGGSVDNPDTMSQEVLSTLRELVARVESIEQIAQAESEMQDETDRFAALEGQLANIAGQLGSIGHASEAAMPDLSPITERLDHIEGQIASSRDIVLDIATEAARKAAEGAGSAGDETAYATVLEELRLLRESRSEQPEAAGTGDQLNEISATINAIASRLAAMEAVESVPYAAQTEHLQQQDAFQPVEAMQDGHPDNEVYADASWQEQAVNQPRPEMHHVEEAPSLDMGYMDAPHVHAEPSAVDDASAISDSEAESTEADDVPLAPGAGMPDLEQLVRNATQRKKEKQSAAPETPDEDGGTSDLLAAARRAAQMASREASSLAESPAKKPGKAKSLPKFKAPSFLNRKTALMSGAALIIALGGFVLAPKFFGSAPSQTASSEQVESLEPGTAAATEEIAQADVTDSEETVDEVRQVGETAQAQSGSALLSSEPVAEIKPSETPSGGEETVTASLETEGETPAVVDIPSDIPAEIGNEALRAAMAAGDGDALFEAGRRYTDGDGVDRSLEEAIVWYRKAAEAGHTPAQYRLGNFYEKGHGISADQSEAAKWYSKAAASGNALAMHNLAVLNAMGVISGEPDMTTAVGWFEKAADMGVKDSQVNLGILYTKGMGVEEDLEAAYKWFAVAARGGDNDAAKKRDTVAQAMRPEQLERARGEAGLWKPKKLDSTANIASVRDEWKSGQATRTGTMDQAELVRQTQILLTRAGFDAGAPDGQFGNRTRNAIIGFQEKMGLTVDGKITPALLEALSKTAI